MKLSLLVPEAYLDSHCRIGQGAACCRYLLASGDGIECGKVQPDFRAQIDARVHRMTAKRNNCSGPPAFSRSS